MSKRIKYGMMLGWLMTFSVLRAQYTELARAASDNSHLVGLLPTFFGKDSAEGSPYLVRGWLRGIVDGVDHKRLPEAGKVLFFNFDKQHEWLYVTDGISKARVWPNDSINSFSLVDGNTIYQFEKVPVISGTHFLQPLVRTDNGYRLYRRLMTKIDPAKYRNVGYYSTGEKFDRYIDFYEYYLVYPGQHGFAKLKLTIRSVRKVLKPESAVVDKFFSQKSGPVDEHTLVLLIQFINEQQTPYRVLHFGSPHNCFPDTARDHGHLDGDSILQPRAGHYDDSSVLLVVPRGLHAGRTVDLVFWFHGWHNNIDTALQFYGLGDQFAAARRNAVLVLPEAARNAADSYGGKMGRQGMFKSLVGDVVDELKRNGLVPPDAVAGHVVLAGHSGAYSVIADILDHGQEAVDEVFLFDALYGHMDSFMHWAEDSGHHFVHWFTNTGYGPDKVSDAMMLRLRQAQVPYGLCEEASVNAGVLKDNRILFVHSPRQHNVIINKPDDFALLLVNSSCLGY